MVERSSSRYGPLVSALKDLLSRPDQLPAGAVLHAARPWQAASDVLVSDGDEPPAGYEYLLEVEGVLDVLEVWSAWRDGQLPNPEQAAAAVIHYAERDAYIPVD